MRRSKQKRKDGVRIDGVPGLALGEEALYAMRHCPLSVHLAYLVGTVPFLLTLLFYWFDMSRNATATLSIAPTATALAVLFVWMKVWHVVFTTGVREFISGRPARPWTVIRVWRIFHRQVFMQALSLIVLPIALLAMLPFPWAYAFFHNVTVLDDEEGAPDRLLARAWRQAALWPRQNLTAIWLFSPWNLGVVIGAALLMAFLLRGDPNTLELMAGTDMISWMGFGMVMIIFIPMSPLGMLLSLNVGMCLALIPWAMRTFLGVHTMFNMAGPWSVLNSSYLAMIFCLCFLAMDPIIKTIYTLRAYYGGSLETGEAIRTDILTYRRMAARLSLVTLFVAGMFFFVQPASAQEGAAIPVVAADVPLDHHIDDVLQKREYQWRTPRTNAEDEALVIDESEALLSLREMFKTAMKAVEVWMEDLFKSKGPKPVKPPGAWNWNWNWNWGFWQGLDAMGWALLVVAVAAIGGVVVLLCMVVKKNRRVAAMQGIAAQAVAVVPALPNVADESVMADELPSDEWVRMGEEFLSKGELRLALRAFYLATLAALAHIGVVRLARHKSNRDYSREVQRGLRDKPEVITAFVDNLRQVECSWYGDHLVDQMVVTLFRTNQNRILGYVRSKIS